MSAYSPYLRCLWGKLTGGNVCNIRNFQGEGGGGSEPRGPFTTAKSEPVKMDRGSIFNGEKRTGGSIFNG